MTIDDVMTASEAAERWGLNVFTVRKDLTGQNGLPGKFWASEARKSGNTWLVTKSGMNRVYGKESEGTVILTLKSDIIDMARREGLAVKYRAGKSSQYAFLQQKLLGAIMARDWNRIFDAVLQFCEISKYNIHFIAPIIAAGDKKDDYIGAAHAFSAALVVEKEGK